MARHLLPGPSLAGQLKDVLGNQLVPSIRLSTFRPLSSTHRRIGFESCTILVNNIYFSIQKVHHIPCWKASSNSSDQTGSPSFPVSRRGRALYSKYFCDLR
jgi:hypothetical protein